MKSQWKYYNILFSYLNLIIYPYFALKNSNKKIKNNKHIPMEYYNDISKIPYECLNYDNIDNLESLPVRDDDQIIKIQTN